MIKTDVLYIHPTKRLEDNTSFGHIPMGIIGILNDLKKENIQVYGINLAVEKAVTENFSLEEEFKNIDYKVLLIDLHWYEHSYGTISTAQISKDINPTTPIIIGGYTSGIYWEEILDTFNCVDYVVTGDSELPTRQLVKYLLKKDDSIKRELIPNISYRKDGLPYKNKDIWVQDNLDDINFIDIGMFKNLKYMPFMTIHGVDFVIPSYWLCIASGCKYNCSYCCGARCNMQKIFNRSNMLVRSPQKIVEDMKALHNIGIKRISVSHDFSILGKKFYKELFSKIRDENIKPGLYLELWQLPDKEFIDDLVNTFDMTYSLIAITAISGDEDLRYESGKKFKNEDLINIINHVKQKKLNMLLFYTQNIFKETREQFLATCNQVEYIHKNIGLKKDCILYQKVVIDPLARMRDYKGINVSFNKFIDYYNYCKKPGNDDLGWSDLGEISLEDKKKMFDNIFI